MKKLMFTLMAVMLAAVNANAMSYEQARNEALFLTDKMAYELNLTDAQYEAAYEINLDYLMGVTSQADVYGPYWERRNLDLSYILFTWQWDLFRAATYFYRPLYWNAGYWHFGIYARYPHRDYFYFGRPHFYATYRGGHSWRMNGGRSYYEGRHHIYRPEGHSRNNHFGMRNGWDRGDYRGDRGGHRSSTQITGDRHGGGSRGNINGGSFGDGTRGGRNNGGSFDGNRGGRNNGGSFDGNRGGHNNGGSFDGNRGGSNNGGSFDGNRGGRNNGGSFDGNRGGSNNGGSFGGGSRGGSNNGGSFGGGSRGGSNNGGGSFGGGTRGGNSGGSFGGGSRGGGHSGGGSVGAGSRGGGHSGGGRSGRR